MAKIKSRIDDFRPDQRLVDERGATAERLNHLRPSPINLALGANKLTREQGLAAEKFYKHWHQSGLVGSLPSVDPNRVFGGDGFDFLPKTENQVFHRERYAQAKKKIEKDIGGVHFWVLEQIVCYEKTFTEVGAFFGHKNRTRQAQVAFDLLLRPLNLLCMEWGIS